MKQEGGKKMIKGFQKCVDEGKKGRRSRGGRTKGEGDVSVTGDGKHELKKKDRAKSRQVMCLVATKEPSVTPLKPGCGLGKRPKGGGGEERGAAMGCRKEGRGNGG